MKKFLSLVLTVVMLHSTFSCLTFTVSAAGDVESVSYTMLKPIELIENTNGYWDERGYYDENEDYVYEDIYLYDFPHIPDYIQTFTVNYTGGTTEEFIWNEDQGEYCSATGEYLEYSTYDTQWDNPWVIGENNSFKIEVYNREVEVPVTILENPVASVSYTMLKPIEIIENTNGCWDEREYYDEESGEYVYEDIYLYDFPYLPNYVEKFILNYTDGTTEDFIWNEEQCEYCNTIGEYLDYSPYDTQWDNPWVIGENNSFKIIVYGKEVDIPVTILENPVTSISYTLSQPIELIENTNGYWDERGYYDENEDYVYEEYFYYYTKDISEYIEKFTVNYSDGTTEDFIWDEDEQKYCSSIGQYLDYSTYENQWNNPWKKGENNNLKVVAFGKEMYVPITFVEYDVASISYTPISPVKLIEGLDVYREPWDEIDRYRTDKYTICNEGDILTITFSDGSVKEYVCHLPDRYDSDGYGVHFFDSEGNELPFGNESSNFYFFGMDEYVNQWTVGNEYEVICCFMGVNTTIPVKIVENPVESISYTPNSFELIENNDGYWTQEYVWIGDEPEMKEYYKYNFDISNGDTLNVNYTDGSSINYIYDSYSEDFVAPDGRRILTYYVNRKSYRALAIESNQSYENQWITGNSYEFIVSYMGRETTIPVTVTVCDHIWVKGEGLINSPPSCTEPGWDSEFCEKCESIREFEIPATGHTEVKDKAVEATCTETGLTEGSHCSVCNAVLKAQTVVPAKGHTEVKDKAVEATCTKTGLTEGSHCSVCNAVLKAQTVVKAKGHTSSGWKTDKKATVNKAGSKHKECTECGKVLKTAKIDQLKCSKPSLKKIENTADGVKITWGKVSGADKYYVYRKTGSNGKYPKIATVKGNSKVTYTDKKAKSGKKYYYYVKAVNEAGSSDASKSKSILYLADTTLSTPKSTKNGVTLKWKKVTGAEGYVVYRKTGSGKYEKIATVKGNSKVTYTDKKAKKGKTYTYKIKAYKSKTYSAYSNSKKIKDKY